MSCLNSNAPPQILDVAVDGNRALARIRHNLQPRALNATLPGGGGVPPFIKHLLTFPFILSAEFTFEVRPQVYGRMLQARAVRAAWAHCQRGRAECVSRLGLRHIHLQATSHAHPAFPAQQDTPRGKRIVSWVEDISVYTLLYNIPFAEHVRLRLHCCMRAVLAAVRLRVCAPLPAVLASSRVAASPPPGCRCGARWWSPWVGW